MNDELATIADQMDQMAARVVARGELFGTNLVGTDTAKFNALLLDAKAIANDRLGVGNEYSSKLGFAGIPGLGGINLQQVRDASEIIQAAIRQIRRKALNPAPSIIGRPSYVSPGRIAELQAAKGKFDFRVLIELCRELNVAANAQCHMATAMIVRTIMNHVPPVFGFERFDDFAHQHGGNSFKATMQRLQKSLKHIADHHLHSQIRPRETLPTEQQVNFAAELDVLLGEVIREGAHNL